MPDPSNATGAHPGVPASWPSAWSSTRREVLLGCIIPVVAAVLAVIILLVTSAFDTAWWVALIPLLLLVWPLSLPARVRGAMQKASSSGQIDVTVAQLGTLVRARSKRMGVHPSAEVIGDRVRYYTHGGAAR